MPVSTIEEEQQAELELRYENPFTPDQPTFRGSTSTILV
jgi:hypothetical protein